MSRKDRDQLLKNASQGARGVFSATWHRFYCRFIYIVHNIAMNVLIIVGWLVSWQN